MTDLANNSDETLLRRSASGDEEAFVTLYRRRQAGIYRFALHMSGSEPIAEEIVQEVFMTVIREVGKFDANRGSVQAFLIGVARNYVLRALERNRLYVGLEEETEEGSADGSDVLGDLTRAEAIENLRKAVLELPAAYREAIVLCDLEELSYADAAASLELPVGTIRSRVSRGRALLAQKLAGAGSSGSDSLRCFA